MKTINITTVLLLTYYRRKTKIITNFKLIQQYNDNGISKKKNFLDYTKSTN